MIQDPAPALRETYTTEDRERIFKNLHDLSLLLRDTLEENTVSLEDVQKLSAYLTTMRELLVEVAGVENRMNRCDHAVTSLRMLKEQFWDLEGKVKEMRNSLDRGKSRTLDSNGVHHNR